MHFCQQTSAVSLFRTEGLRKTGNVNVFRRDKASAVGTDGRESPNLAAETYAAQR